MKANSTIEDFSKSFSGKLDAVEKRLEAVERRELETSTDTGSSGEKLKRKVPTRVRVSHIMCTFLKNSSQREISLAEFSGFMGHGY